VIKRWLFRIRSSEWWSTNANAFFSDNDDDWVCLSNIQNNIHSFNSEIHLHRLATVNPLNVAFWQAIRAVNSLQITWYEK
jgi:hypothetical protein